MNGCTPGPHEAITGGPARPPDERPGPMARRLRDRQAAAQYLKAAARTGDASLREVLRRRAACLLGPPLLPDLHLPVS
ncbi:MAG TPA: hypothetical protein VMR21_15245 [Vicinamibacteria bacterium]|nr:hypothetical protein [Vicinamibacteria bacterium]